MTEGICKGQQRTPYGYGKGVLEQSTSYFFTSFPEDWEIGDMWKAFIKCGRAIQNPTELEDKLNQIKFDKQSLKANIAIFSREETKLKQRDVKEVRGIEVKRNGRSYAEVLKDANWGEWQVLDDDVEEFVMVEMTLTLVGKEEGEKVPDSFEVADMSINVEKQNSNGEVAMARNEENIGCVLLKIEKDFPTVDLGNDLTTGHSSSVETHPLDYGASNWCIGGDFNAIRDMGEKKGKWYDPAYARDFSKFIIDAGLEYVPMIGRKFTWYKSDGTIMSKLDSPTEEFQTEKGLHQGDPLAPFLFLVVAAALNELIMKVVDEGIFKGVSVGHGEVEITHLQFVDDTILFGEAIKCIVRSFELISGLKANFFKSSISSVNVEKEDLNDMAKMLNCMPRNIPFMYLGVPVGANLRKLSTWTPVIDCFRHKLLAWRCDSLSFGGRIILLNAVLSSIPVYYFSTLKAPKKVLNLLSLIQKRGDEWEIHCSSWWKNIWNINDYVMGREGWFRMMIERMAREGKRWFKDNRIDGYGSKTQMATTRVPPKVSAFAWKAMQNRIPTKKNLQKRKVLSSEDDMSCALCSSQIESSDHLLFMCPEAWKVWSSCYNWWGVNVVSQDKGWNHLLQHVGLFNNKITREAWMVIWFAAIWIFGYGEITRSSR
ncbi:hypothetical protein SLEP1_g56407 [Rubroshorea leprosula]|uniref:Reverse transcriptase zinc-binding domain-containing protein n=1 Tax=Rubroshorea leprosula TaxID=152421 RepID=A0AAV5MJJ5_9ROSI|nr:hypothetical protein SLEP1_g56407 [Rubroshorea leprosula]